MTMIHGDNKRHECPRHGTTDAYMHVCIYEPAPAPLDLTGAGRLPEMILQRHYCMHCLVEQLDKLGVQDMAPARRRPTDSG